MNKDIYQNANAPTAIAVVIRKDRKFDYFFKIKRRSYFCYKPYIVVERSQHNYIIKIFNNENILSIAKDKSIEDVVNILNVIGIKNNSIFLCKICNREKTMSKKRFYNLKSVITFIYKTEEIMENVKLK